ncbi:hypothetical protein L1049_027189 [Liquidambar formosana]|uniref:Uncharacterized protein n=1 Tax=Liquidambar formosana TaxID=63359 RepID=A0AAP0N885_LIQFO
MLSILRVGAMDDLAGSGPPNKASKEPFGKSLYHQEYWSSVSADALGNFIIGCTYRKGTPKELELADQPPEKG